LLKVALNTKYQIKSNTFWLNPYCAWMITECFQ
jgi:hypothetical protein